MTGGTLRWATEADARAVAIVHVDSWRAAYAGLIPSEVLAALSVEQRTAGWTRWIAASLRGDATDLDAVRPHRLLVAEDGERIVGWAAFGPGRDPDDGHRGELGGLYVHPDHWSTGVGAALIRRAEQELRTAGHSDAYVWVLTGNDRAIGFYERQGWRADGASKIADEGSARALVELRHTKPLS
ncbi:GNAT family N-acetyltransferase [Pseudoclavibacter sp. RFBJ3]|uniref:GNAT family N-acetyltransferase n=1 Tax=unclassified Pseudoclavibacter TaxID=2615177 RepID=UPI000CE85495|nr:MULTISPECIES: GNAT family N-acetyltransferase [unclassified Pseudoclavibacter]PPF87191.1 GNAT family N-acetyltransferase [Pseudoclavibacter sp. RFBJ5]PPF89414.1 GNAT family N-acetyltransferase [Pseudoclavibacter sp. RFBJ3]PPG00780.1 GNAT family N-acetyltransferase [Pseudoclavibacter sp. RFBH5]PPG18888.1 GNAT family N-acetyltransferase [Pseudoclavibacter sp. RFBI4]